MLKIGIVGLRRGRAAFVFNQFPDCRVTAVCDINEDVLRQVADENDVPQRFANYEDLLDSDVDAVFLATPMMLHAQQAAQALRAGKHVLSEVAAGFTWRDMWLLAEAAAASDAKYMLAENYCYMRHVMLARALAEAGLFGELYFGEGEYVHDCKHLMADEQGRPTWRAALKRIRGNNYPTHSLGPLYTIFKEPVRWVSSFGSGAYTIPGGAADDCVLTICQTESGKMLKLRYDVISNRPPNLAFYSLQGTHGAYEAPRGLGDDHKVYIIGHCEHETWRPLWDFDEYLPAWYRELEAEAESTGHGGSDYFTAWEFYRAIVEDRQPEIDVWTALNISAVIPASRDSMARGCVPVRIPDFRTEVSGQILDDT